MSLYAQRFDSRQSMRNSRFEVFHYRDRKPENVGVHHHEFFEIYYFVGGNVTFRVEGKTYRLEMGDILLMCPGELHQTEIAPETVYERIVLWMDRTYLSSLGAACGTDLTACFDPQNPNHIHLLRLAKTDRVMFSQLLDKLVREYYSEEVGSFAYAQGLLLQALVELNRLTRQTRIQPEKREEPDLIDQVLAYISTNYAKNITLSALAGEFYVSKYYLSHEFSSRVGTSVYRYVIIRRLLQARELIASGVAPGAVYQSCGFGDYANFYRAFKNEYGISPRVFAEQMAGTAHSETGNQ